MNIPIEELLNLPDEFLYDYLNENRNYNTKNELKELAKAKQVYFSTSDSKDDIRKSILIEIAIKKVNGFLNPDKEIKYMDLNKVKQFTPKEKIHFVKSYGKYLRVNDLISLIYNETNSYPPEYSDLLKEIYLKTQEDLIKEAIK
ncbi:hypothetical protein [Cytobacillus firmus]